jgi:hypothetical protein
LVTRLPVGVSSLQQLSHKARLLLHFRADSTALNYRRGAASPTYKSWLGTRETRSLETPGV